MILLSHTSYNSLHRLGECRRPRRFGVSAIGAHLPSSRECTSLGWCTGIVSSPRPHDGSTLTCEYDATQRTLAHLPAVYSPNDVETVNSGKLAYGILHRSTPECHSGRGIRLRGSMRQIPYVVVSDKDAKSCMRSGYAPALERTRLQADFCRANSLYLRGVWLCLVLGEDGSRQDGTPRPAPAWHAPVTLRYCLTMP